MPGEPGVGLDRHRVGPERLGAGEDRIHEPRPVALRGQVPPELVDEQSAVGEDQNPKIAGGLDEACSGDRLPRGGGMTEAVSPGRAGVGADESWLELLIDAIVDDAVIEVLVVLEELSLILELRGCVAVPILVSCSLRCGDQLGEHSRERVDLVAPETGTGRGRRCGGGEHALEAQHQPVPHLPAGGRRPLACLHLDHGIVERGASRGTGRERDICLLTRMEERLAEPLFGAKRGGPQALRRLRRLGRDDRGFLHMREQRRLPLPPLLFLWDAGSLALRREAVPTRGEYRTARLDGGIRPTARSLRIRRRTRRAGAR